MSYTIRISGHYRPQLDGAVELNIHISPGLLRDFFAGCALVAAAQFIRGVDHTKYTREQLIEAQAETAYAVANAMLTERAKQQTPTKE